MRFIQFSDTHLRADISLIRGVDTAAALEQAVEEANRRAEFVVHTGDIVSRPADAASYRRYSVLLKALSPQIRHVPGNHDDVRLMRAYLGSQDGYFPWSFVRRGVRFIGLDSSGGALDTRQLRQLSSLLAEPDTPTVIFLHHHLCEMEESWLNPYRLGNTGDLSQVLRAANSRVIGLVHGHIHHYAKFAFEHVPVYSAPALSAQFDPHGEFLATTDDGPACVEFEITPAGSVSRRIVRCET